MLEAKSTFTKPFVTCSCGRMFTLDYARREWGAAADLLIASRICKGCFIKQHLPAK